MKINEKLKNLWVKDKKLIIIVLLGVIGISLIALSELLPTKKTVNKVKSEETTESNTYETVLETKIRSIVSQIDGAGKAEVVLTMQSGEEKSYAKNSTTDDKTDSDSRESKLDSEYVIVNGENGDECVLLRSDYPKVQGVIVVCEGGDNPTVKNSVTNAVSALLGLNTNNISVLKMKNTEE